MKFSIRKRNNERLVSLNNTIIKKAAFGSALFLMSAFAMFSQQVYAAEPNQGKKMPEVVDSVFNARSIFEKMQCSALELLPVSARLDMLDYWDVDSVYKASNAMEGLSWLETVSADYLKVRLTPVSTLEIKVLPEKKSRIVMTIHTVGDDVQAQDSQVKFYDESLNEVATDKHLVMPQIKDFFEIPKGSATKMKEIEQMIPFPTIAFSANPENTDLEARLTVEKYINEDDWNIAKLFAKPYITSEWKKDKYKF